MFVSSRHYQMGLSQILWFFKGIRLFRYVSLCFWMVVVLI